MKIEINAKDEHRFLSSFAETVGAKVERGRVNIPAAYGSGYVLGFLFGNRLRMVVRNYELKEDMLIKRGTRDLQANTILISFNNILKNTKEKSNSRIETRNPLPSVIITTQGLESEVYLQRNKSFKAINLGIDASYLRELLNSDVDNAILKNIVENKQPLVFEQLVSADLQKIASEITDTIISAPLQNFFYKLKAEELICYLFMELIQREDSKVHAINIADIKMLYAVRDKLISNLAEAPTVVELASYARMSESKLKRSFKQVFGNSLYNYYQKVRMEEAAFLLKQENRSVSEVGYALGFSNLSHFTRVFEEHIGMKPKKFSVA